MNQVQQLVADISQFLPSSSCHVETGVYVTQRSRSLVHLKKAFTELESAISIDEVKDIRDKAEAMRVYAQQAKLSLEMQNMCAELKLRAEKRIGEMLKKMNINSNSSQNLLRGTTLLPRENTPTLEELGIGKAQSSRCQMLSSLSPEVFEERIQEIKDAGKELTSSDMLKFAKNKQREAKRAARIENGIIEMSETDDAVQILQGDFRETLQFIPDDSVDLLITDPPYVQKSIPLIKDLGSFGKRVLKSCGLLITYAGNYYLSEFVRLLTRELTYVWTAAVVYPSSPATLYRYRIKSRWKPVLIFSKSEYAPDLKGEWFCDRLEGDGRTKENHDWEQGLGEAHSLIEYFTFPGDVVVDPFLGSGTNAVAAKRLRRKFIGCDIDEIAVGTSRARINDEQRRQKTFGSAALSIPK